MPEAMSRAATARVADKSYKAAIDVLRSRRRPQRPTTDPLRLPKLAPSIPETNGPLQIKGQPSRVGMDSWLRRIGHSTAEVDKLNIIHVAGTKGKGSTCAYAESLLRAYGSRTGFPARTGLYTSPHLISYEERIRINKAPISRDLFAKYFFEVWDALLATDEGVNHLPRHFQLLALVSMHAFISEGVQAAVYETHHGGEYDATNVIENPVITIITSLGMDHVRQLGPGIENIAWHKAGIFKRGADAFSAAQDEAPARVLRERAAEKDVTLRFVADGELLDKQHASQLKPDVQRLNCTLALAAVNQFLKRTAPAAAGPVLHDDITKAIQDFSWPGRFQTIEDGDMKWYLEGAHNDMSITKSAEWFGELAQEDDQALRILVFNQISEEKDGAEIFTKLASSLSHLRVDHVLLTDYIKYEDFDGIATEPAPDEKSQGDREREGPTTEEMTRIWHRYQPESVVVAEPGIESALARIRELVEKGKNVQTLVTGSLYLVGGALYHLEKQMGRTSQ
ncbi:hypothetical protein NLU13_8028 [Sarocladium strictum]|uniref:Folylpolyglutamate synthase n=1 Tax=Sarocladium strictum TaxID=5046 RepID=A0AA39GD60_SARSR|nr:hypothetical protein NLU13_8028 [Sarocladium strictum]